MTSWWIVAVIWSGISSVIRVLCIIKDMDNLCTMTLEEVTEAVDLVRRSSPWAPAATPQRQVAPPVGAPGVRVVASAHSVSSRDGVESNAFVGGLRCQFVADDHPHHLPLRDLSDLFDGADDPVGPRPSPPYLAMVCGVRAVVAAVAQTSPRGDVWLGRFPAVLGDELRAVVLPLGDPGRTPYYSVVVVTARSGVDVLAVRFVDRAVRELLMGRLERTLVRLTMPRVRFSACALVGGEWTVAAADLRPVRVVRPSPDRPATNAPTVDVHGDGNGLLVVGNRDRLVLLARF